MATGKFISYLRVSTQEQGRSGLGLEAQRKAITDFLNGGCWSLLAEFQEVESGKAHLDRPALAQALDRCKLTGATLLIAKLDRLSRDAHFLLGLQKSGVRFVAVDVPEANDLTIGILAVVAQAERSMISQRTKAALEAAKARGVRLGNPNGFSGKVYREAGQAAKERATEHAQALEATLQGFIDNNLSMNAMARELGRQGIQTARGGAWTATAVRNVLVRLGLQVGKRGTP